MNIKSKIILISGVSLIILLTSCTQKTSTEKGATSSGSTYVANPNSQPQRPPSLTQQVEDERNRLEIDRIELERKKIQMQKDSLDNNPAQATYN